MTCYLPIARGVLGGEPVIRAIADRHAATPEQVALAFEFAKGYRAIATSGKAERIRSNFEAVKLRLSAKTSPQSRAWIAARARSIRVGTDGTASD